MTWGIYIWAELKEKEEWHYITLPSTAVTYRTLCKSAVILSSVWLWLWSSFLECAKHFHIRRVSSAEAEATVVFLGLRHMWSTLPWCPTSSPIRSMEGNFQTVIWCFGFPWAEIISRYSRFHAMADTWRGVVIFNIVHSSFTPALSPPLLSKPMVEKNWEWSYRVRIQWNKVTMNHQVDLCLKCYTKLLFDHGH